MAQKVEHKSVIKIKGYTYTLVPCYRPAGMEANFKGTGKALQKVEKTYSGIHKTRRYVWISNE